MKTVRTYCRICEPACSLLATVDQGEISLEPDRDHPVHKGFCCHKGLSFGAVHSDPDRVNVPLRRTNKGEYPAEFEEISWDEAFHEIGARLGAYISNHGPDAIAIYNGNPLAFDSRGYPAKLAFEAKLGTSKTFSGVTQDCSNKMVCTEEVYGTGSMQPIPDLEHTDYFLCLGANPRVSHMSVIHTTDPMGQIRDIVKRGGKVRYVNPRRIESVADDSEWVQIKPDTDVYLLAALINVIERTTGFDRELTSKHAKNLDGLSAFVSHYPPEAVSEITGLSETRITEIANDFARASSATVYMSTGVNQSRQGTLAYWLVQMLSLVTGNLGRRGGNVYASGYAPGAAMGATAGADPFFESPIGKMRYAMGALPGNLFAEYLSAESTPTKALVVVSGNPLLAMSAEFENRTLFEKLETVICIDIYRNATSEYADFVLPAADWLEREDVNALGSGYQPEPYLQYTQAVVEPAFERKPDWWILARLEQILGLPSVLDGNGDSWETVDQMLAPAGTSVEELKTSPGQVAEYPKSAPEDIFTLGIQTADKKIDCCPERFTSLIENCASIFEDLKREPERLFKLISRRTIYMHNSWLQNVPVLKRPAHLTNPLYMNPEDALREGFEDGQFVQVTNEYGSISAELKVDDTLLSGVVAMTHGWGNDKTPGMRTAHANPGVNVNQLMPRGPGSYEAFSNMSFMTGFPVNITHHSAS